MLLLKVSKPRKPTELNVQGKRVCFPNMAKQQEFPAADSFLFWNAHDVRPVRDRLNGSVCVCPDSSCTRGGHSKQLRALAPRRGNASAVLMLGPSPAALLFLAQAMTSDISLGFKFRLGFGGSLTSERTGPQSKAEPWPIATRQSPQWGGWGAEVSALLGMRVWSGV